MDNKVNYLLRLGDNALILSQQLSRWCGKGPALEEDMALTNVALDLLGQTRLWYDYAAELEGAGRDEDALAYLRDAQDFKNCLLLEQPNGNYADTLMRQFYFDTWHYFLIAGLTAADFVVYVYCAKWYKCINVDETSKMELQEKAGQAEEEVLSRV